MVDNLDFKTSNSTTPAIAVNIYPNPTTDRIKIRSNQPEELKVRLFDLEGRIINQAQGTGIQQMDVSQLPSGVYIVDVNQGMENYRKRIIVKK